MLTQLLPGFRELRSPLATGVLWLLTLWVAVGDRMPSRTEATGFAARVYDLAELTGRPGVGAALIFTAYVIGSVVSIPANQLLREPAHAAWDADNVLPDRWPVLQGRPVLTQHPSAPAGAGYPAFSDTRLLTRQAWADLQSHVSAVPLLLWLESQRSERHRDVARRILLRSILEELGQLGTRLHAQNSALYDDHDRLMAEADLRVNIGAGVAVLAGALSVRVSPLCLLVFAVSALLIIMGLARARQANDVIVQALVIGEVTSTALAEADRTAEALAGAPADGRPGAP
ncbi:hypothetical protein [Streptomyces alfalfae]|uniref:Uncharacterized protein n=1 Tax=Streptomyces alfalfae TaxID=1642299 RepID=A0A7T4TZ84_9ACTN|nr:hypothetical protein [Streptomyces alfalfae]QQC91069.1 hypothetical protein I8755_23665 [Streptomyces alfalfae]QUI33556.1 hypothetical protein H9W91_23855 [Streptomyces alfalfae]